MAVKRRDDYERMPPPQLDRMPSEIGVVPIDLKSVCDMSERLGGPPVRFAMIFGGPTVSGGNLILEINTKEDADKLINHLIAARNRVWPHG